ncbi:TRAP transporter substrate-binding protein [Elioraea sp.]|uniref:TRAP transporter substrate-binding protein n=1 Tax=Elioraea sp. TaxID=2185103 RepID=UPI0025BCF900|nr:TRAP transporter substrate-binding protein [Elioraea sp.]
MTERPSRRTMIRATALGAAGAVAAPAIRPAQAQGRVNWRCASFISQNTQLIGAWAHRVTEDVAATTDNSFRIRWNEPGTLVPTAEFLEAVGRGAIDCAFISPGFFAGRFSVAPLFSSIPFGPDAVGQYAWMTQGGGTELFNKYLAEFNVVGVVSGMIGAQGLGWFRRPINSVEDLRGLRMRVFGYAGAVLQKLGVSPQLLPPGEIYQALELGTIDATEFSTPLNDEEAGFWRIAKHYYFPSWHEPFSLACFIVNRDRWNALTEPQRKLFTRLNHASSIEQVAMSNSVQGPVLQRFRDRGVTVATMPEDVTRAAHRAWQEVVAENIARDPKFKETWESLQAFLARYNAFADLAYSYQKINFG